MGGYGGKGGPLVAGSRISTTGRSYGREQGVALALQRQSPPSSKSESKIPQRPAVGWLLLELLEPQHSTEPSRRKPQACVLPAEIALNIPSGGVACPKPFIPQHETLPVVLNPQVKSPPADTY